MASVLDYLQMFGMRKGATPEQSLGAAEFWKQYQGRPLTPIQAQPGEPTIQARQPGVMERVGYALQGDTRASLGQQRAIGTLRTLADLTPLAALDAKGPQEAALAILPGAGGPMGREAMAAAKQGIRAYHGSPHDFDRFRLSPETIGTGEGAQAYGHGLYFAGNEGVARSYRDALSKYGMMQSDKGILDYSKVEDPVQKLAMSALLRNSEPSEAKFIARNWNMPKGIERDTVLKAIDDLAAINARPAAHMYEVNINARPEQFLDWDKPLAQQPEAARGMLPGKTSWGFEPRTGEDLYRSIAGEAKVGRVNPAGAEATATAQLREAGIPGIKYLDQGSRITGDAQRILEAQGSREKALELARNRLETASKTFAVGGTSDRTYWQNIAKQLEKPETSNYVVFDDQLIDILRKYGLAGFGMLGAGGAALDQQQNR